MLQIDDENQDKQHGIDREQDNNNDPKAHSLFGSSRNAKYLYSLK